MTKNDDYNLKPQHTGLPSSFCIIKQCLCVFCLPACLSAHTLVGMFVEMLKQCKCLVNRWHISIDGKMVLVIVDAHNKYIDAHIVNAATSSAIIIKLRQTFATHDLPSALVSDNATCFKSSEFEEFCRLNGVQHVTSAPSRPASNGAAERAVQTVKAGLRKTEGSTFSVALPCYSSDNNGSGASRATNGT